MAPRIAAYTLLEQGWILRIRPALDPASRKVALMLHGWTGDENVMSIFDRYLSPDTWLISPRGRVSAAPGGYGWAQMVSPDTVTVRDFAGALDELDAQVQHWLDYFHIGAEIIDLMGFSQGGAMALSYLVRRPERIGRTACLSGFLPKNTRDILEPDSLLGKRVLLTHGTKDKNVPFQLARDAAGILTSAGAEVQFCQDELGHKLGPNGSRCLKAFFI